LIFPGPMDGNPSQSTRLDPLDALIYYLCVSQAILRGDYIVPASHVIAAQLVTKKSNRNDHGVGEESPAVKLWQDLLWMHRNKLLFDERELPKSSFFRNLAQHNVNERIRKFQPGFEMVNTRQRRLVTSQFVDQPATA